uniref:hypothetical protein n=1 Tax=Clostridium sp. TaxID=1506 RepID=UPI0026392802
VVKPLAPSHLYHVNILEHAALLEFGSLASSSPPHKDPRQTERKPPTFIHLWYNIDIISEWSVG